MKREDVAKELETSFVASMSARKAGAETLRTVDELERWAVSEQEIANNKYNKAIGRWGNCNLSNAYFARSVALAQVVNIIRHELILPNWPNVDEKDLSEPSRPTGKNES